MTKVMLSQNIRFLDEVGSLSLDKGKAVELKADSLKDMLFRRYLFTGNIRVVEGSISFQYKEAKLFLSADGYPFIFGEQYGKFFKKDVDLDVISWVEFESLPKNVQDSLKVAELPKTIIETPKEIIKDLPKEEIKKVVEGDLNGDGKFDKEDLKMAGKTLAKGVKKLIKGK